MSEFEKYLAEALKDEEVRAGFEAAEARADLTSLIAAKLITEGCYPGGDSGHSWRCAYPEKYGPCDCVKEIAVEVVAVIEDYIETRLNDCDTEAPRRNERHQELLAKAFEEGKRETWKALGAPFIWAAPENPYEGSADA